VTARPLLAVLLLVLLAGCAAAPDRPSVAAPTGPVAPTPADAPTAPWPVGVPAGTRLTASGAITVSTDRTVLTGLDVQGSVLVRARDVVIRRCRFTGSGQYYAVQLAEGASVLIEDSTIRGDYASAGISAGAWQGVRLDIHGVSHDGAKLGPGASLTDSWVHDFRPEPGAHADGLQSDRTAGDITVTHNVIDIGSAAAATNSAIILTPGTDGSAPGPVRIADNVLGGGGYTLYYDPAYSDTTVTDNTFRADARYGPLYPGPEPAVFTGNTRVGGGALTWPPAG
jgi:hypothetical protein